MPTPSTSLSRRRAPSKGDRREQAILDVAREALQHRSLASLTVDQLASGAGISRSSFYFYFESKDAVLTALLDGLSAELAAENSAWLDGTGPDEPALRAALQHSIELWRTSGGLLRQANAVVGTGTELDRWRSAVVERGVRRLTARIERDRAAGWGSRATSAASLARMTSALRNATLAEYAGVIPDDQLVDDLVVATMRLLYGDASTAAPDRDAVSASSV